ncbi:MAG TPA: 2-dehydropantoate 2-reductase [Vicinamibacterales bacterium]|nr:2-dehydropantoate 2-reductase [Vicinamibacterales bacterium]
MPQPESIVVLGAGAIGSVYAAKLSAHHPVTVVARPEHVQAIRSNGLRLIGRETTTVRVNAVTRLDALAANTVVLLTTKVNASEAALAPIAELVRDDTVIVCVQNGLDSEGIARRAVRNRCPVLRAITQFGAIFQGPGLINFTASGYTLLEDGPFSAGIAAMLTTAGLDGRISPDIKTEIWRKLIFNCVINPITAVTGTEVGGIADPRLDPLKRLVIDECLEVARSEGVSFEIDFLPTIADVFGASRTIASMRQDLMRGRPTEIDHMNGAVAALGRQKGIDCPVNSALTAIIKAMDRCTMTP